MEIDRVWYVPSPYVGTNERWQYLMPGGLAPISRNCSTHLRRADDESPREGTCAAG